VELAEAAALIGAAVEKKGGVWADLGAGSGTFTRALAELLGATGMVYAVDQNASTLRGVASASRAAHGRAAIRTIVADLTEPLGLPPLDGVVLANSLHYVPYADQPATMTHIASLVVPGAPIIVVEYDRQDANRYVPYPISPAALAELARGARLGVPRILATTPSQYSGTIYSAVVRRDPTATG
jgi:ubiquinone/menaquinone biosynthesis C-methylase UbiE